MANQQLVTVSTTHQAGTLGWRHVLAWRQLSIFWQIPVSYFLAESCSANSGAAAAYSVAIRYGESNGQFAEHCYRTQTPVVAFLDRVRVRLPGTTNSLVVERQDHYLAENRFRHVFRVEQRHPLVEGLPETVSIYGSCPIVTPLHIENGMQVLVSFDGIPIIAIHQRHLLVGADPWQFGVPSVPMLYKVLSNWLSYHVGHKPRLLEPYVAIRIDDLPTTAEQLRTSPPSRALDKARSKTIRRLRQFGRHTSTRFTLMYSSHFREGSGDLTPIAAVMPRAIREIRAGVKEGLFEVGSHGMVHLRGATCAESASDPREFIDLDAEQTLMHLKASEREILRLFDQRPESFVAPAWAYRPGITKEVAGKRYPAIIDSSQHVESGECDVMFTRDQNDHCVNIVENFRAGDRVLTYGNADFWRCYAAAGIPVHYMQHTDTNWHILRNFLTSKSDSGSSSETSQTRVKSRLLLVITNPRRSRYLRAVCAAALAVLNCCLESASWKLLWMMLTRSSLYTFVRAMKSAGYRVVTLGELRLAAMDYTNSARKDIATGN